MRANQGKGPFWIALVVAGCLSHLCLYGQTTASQRGVQDASSPASGVQPGPYYALVIGNKNYLHLPKLQTPIDDAKAIAQLLHDVFGFQPKVLLDADRNQIMTALVEYRRTLPENSNLLIYYAGHGHHDRDTDEAYWLPVDAQPSNNANWVSADDVTRDVRAMRSVQHILVISDSCYSGYMTQDRDPHAAIEPSERGALLAKMQKSKSRNLMSSGGDEPVADAGAPGHSIFAWAVLQSLRQVDEDQFTASYVFYSFIQRKVGGRSEQLPQYSWIRNSGHDLGDFVFIRQPVAKAGGAAATTPRPTTTPPPANLSALPAGMDPTMADLYSRAKAGNPQAMFELGLDYYDGKGVPKDYNQAAVWYRKAAEAGNAHAMTGLGVMYRHGYGIEKDYQQAFSWFRKAAEAGDAIGMTHLGVMYQAGYGIEKDYQQACSWFRKAAEAGSADGMTFLGSMYQRGYGVEKDYQQAVSWYRKGAEAGSADGMMALGSMYQNGNGVNQDYGQAVAWYRKAAEAGSDDGMTFLGSMYQGGYGVEKDYQQAVSWYRKGAEAGSADGMAFLGSMYQRGYGVEKDYQQAVSWYRKAAEAGNVVGMNNLGVMYENGDGVEKDYQQAVSWYRKGAEAGNAFGMANLGEMYENGYGVEKDQRQAVSWYRKAAQLGNQDAKDQLKRLGESP